MRIFSHIIAFAVCGLATAAGAQSYPTSYTTNVLGNQPSYQQPSVGNNGYSPYPNAGQAGTYQGPSFAAGPQAPNPATYLPTGFDPKSTQAGPKAADAAMAALPAVPVLAPGGPPVNSVKGIRIEGKAGVVDGKTLLIGGRLVVLNGADSPAAGQTCTDRNGMAWECGRKARDRLFQLVDGQRVVCVGRSPATNGVAADCKVGSINLGRTMVQEGLAVDPQFATKAYVANEAEARAAQKGMWVGAFRKPWDFRSEE